MTIPLCYENISDNFYLFYIFLQRFSCQEMWDQSFIGIVYFPAGSLTGGKEAVISAGFWSMKVMRT
jgi:hypothetical protein